jgi:CBS domain containing-hemolysin-like protein
VYKNDNKDAPIGFINKSDVLKNVINNKNDIDFEKLIVQPLYVPETISVLTAIEEMKQSKNYFMFVVDEFGNFEGLATLRDIMEDIAGEMPEQSEELICVQNADGSFEVKGDISLAELERQTRFVVEQSVHYSTLAGFILEKEQSLPVAGSKLTVDGWEIEILSVVNHTIETVKLKQVKKNVSEK